MARQPVGQSGSTLTLVVDYGTCSQCMMVSLHTVLCSREQLILRYISNVVNMCILNIDQVILLFYKKLSYLGKRLMIVRIIKLTMLSLQQSLGCS